MKYSIKFFCFLFFCKNSTRTEDINKNTEDRRHTQFLSAYFYFPLTKIKKLTQIKQPVNDYQYVGWLFMKTQLTINSKCMVATIYGKLKKLYMPFGCWNQMVYILNIVYSLNVLFLCFCSVIVFWETVVGVYHRQQT